MAWECFGEGNGFSTFAAMQKTIQHLRSRMHYRPRAGGADEIGCLIIAQPMFFPREQWIPQPADWPERSLTPVTRSLLEGEYARVWQACLDRALSHALDVPIAERRGAPLLVQPRLGQGAFRVVVTEAYGRSCAVTGEHSLPALDAAHIRPFASNGPNEVRNGILLRADLHRLFDRGYITVDCDLRLRVGERLREDFANGRSYLSPRRQAAAVARSGRRSPGSGLAGVASRELLPRLSGDAAPEPTASQTTRYPHQHQHREGRKSRPRRLRLLGAIIRLPFNPAPAGSRAAAPRRRGRCAAAGTAPASSRRSRRGRSA
jgi:putative restriction endonuclease